MAGRYRLDKIRSRRIPHEISVPGRGTPHTGSVGARTCPSRHETGRAREPPTGESRGISLEPIESDDPPVDDGRLLLSLPEQLERAIGIRPRVSNQPDGIVPIGELL